jgi:hypothetical protein
MPRYISVRLNEFRDACGFDFCRRGASSSTSIFVHHIVPVRCKGAVSLENQLPWYHIFAIHYHKLSMYRYRQFSFPIRRGTPRNFKRNQCSKWVTSLKFCVCTSSAHMPRTTWPWRLWPSVVFGIPTRSVSWMTGFVNLFFYPPLR